MLFSSKSLAGFTPSLPRVPFTKAETLTLMPETEVCFSVDRLPNTVHSTQSNDCRNVFIFA